MKRSAIAAATLALVAATKVPSVTHAQQKREEEKRDDGTTAAIIGGIAALGLGIAIATSKHGDDHKHNNQWDGNLYGDPFSRANHVVCVPRQRQCYERGNYAYSWTRRIFGTSAGWGGSGGSWDNGFGGSGGSWNNGQDLDRARRVCIDRGEDRRLRNILVESVRPDDSKRAYVYLQSRRSQATVSYERWRCEYRYSSGQTTFKRL